MAEMKVGMLIEVATKNLDSLTQTIEQLKKTGDSTDELEKELQELAEALEALKKQGKGSGLEALGADAERLKAKLAEAQKEANELKKISDAKITLGIDNDEKIKKQIQEVGEAFKTLKASGTLSHSELTRAAELQRAKVRELEKELQKAKPALEDVAAGVTKMVAAGAGIATVAKEAIEFEKAMAGVRKAVNASDDDMATLSAQVKELAVELGIVPEKVAEITAAGGRLGVAFKDLPEFTRLAGQMSVAFNISAEAAGDSAAKIANVFQIPLDKVRELGDAINVLGNNTAAQEGQIVEAITRIGGSARQFGLAAEEAAALSSAFIALGKTPEVASTAINALLNRLLTGGEGVRSFGEGLEDLGWSSEQLAAKIRSNPQEALREFLGSLEKLDKQQRAIVITKMFGQEYADDISLAVGSLAEFDRQMALVTDKTQTAGAMQQEFEAQMSTTAAKIEQAQIAVSNIAKTLGEHLLPIIGAVADGVGSAAQALNDFAQEFPLITKLAVLLGTVKVASIAVKAGLKAMGVEGALAFTKITTGANSATAAMIALENKTTTAKAGFGKVSKAVGVLNKGLNALASFSAGWSVGTWLRKESAIVRQIGDEWGRWGAYIDAIFTDRTFEDVRRFYETSAEGEERLKNAKAAREQEERKAAEAAKEAERTAKAQAEQQKMLAEQIAETRNNIATYERSMKVLMLNGQSAGETYKALAEQLQEAEAKLAALNQQAEKDNVHVLSKSAHGLAEAYETLNISAQELETGISKGANKALDAFSVLAHDAGGNVTKLARLYNAAASQVGNSAEAQEELNRRMLDAVAGNEQLAETVKETARAMKSVGEESDKSAKAAEAALSSLNLSMDDVAKGLSNGVTEVVRNWTLGMDTLKQKGQQTASAVQTAFDASISKLKTPADFREFYEALKRAGTLSKLTAEQLRYVQAGMQGGAEAAEKLRKQLAENTEQKKEHNKESEKENELLEKNTDGLKKNTEELKKNKETKGEATEAEEENAKAQEKTEAVSIRLYDATNLNAEAMGRLNELTKEWAVGINSVLRSSGDASFWNQRAKDIALYADQLRDAQIAIDALNESTGAGTVTMEQISETAAQAQRVFFGLDNTTLSNLNAAIDAARQKLADMKQEAEDTRASLEAQLASLRGDDSVARALDEQKKLRELNLKLQEAEAKGQREIADEYRRAIELQKQVFDEERRQQAARKAEEAKRKQEAEQRQNSSTTSGNRSTSSGKGISASEVVDAFDERIAEAEQRGEERFARRIYEAAKRRPR